MINILSLDVDDIRKKLGIKDKRQATIPEMLFPKFKEPTISRWLSYLLNPEQNQYGCDILNILLVTAMGSEYHSEDKEYTVYNQCFLDIDDNSQKNNYIDIFISTKKYIIGIEVKLNAFETDGQTKRYHKVIEELCEREKKDRIEIYLKPNSNTCKPQCSDYRIVTFESFLKGLEELSDKLPQNRDHFLIDEFIMYLKDGPERARFISTLSPYEEQTLNRFHKNLYIELKDLLNEGGYKTVGEKHNGAEGFGFLQLVRTGKERWKNDLNFHYELLWNDSHYLALHKKIILAAHLEPHTQNENRNKIIKFFRSPLYDGRTLFYRELKVDFTTHEGCCNSVKKIIELLGCDEYSNWGVKADQCITELLG